MTQSSHIHNFPGFVLILCKEREILNKILELSGSVPYYGKQLNLNFKMPTKYTYMYLQVHLHNCVDKIYTY